MELGKTPRLLIVSPEGISRTSWLEKLTLTQHLWQWDWVQTPSDVIRLLNKQCYKIIALYADPSLEKSMLALEPFFEVLKTQFPLIPRLLIADSVGIESPLSYLKLGFTHYLPLHHSARLPEVLQAILSQANLEGCPLSFSPIHRVIQTLWTLPTLLDGMQHSLNLLHQSLQLSHCFLLKPDDNQQMKVYFASEQTLEQESWDSCLSQPIDSYSTAPGAFTASALAEYFPASLQTCAVNYPTLPLARKGHSPTFLLK